MPCAVNEFGVVSWTTDFFVVTNSFVLIEEWCCYTSSRKEHMNKRKLGHSELEVAPLALGGNVFGWTADEPTSFKLLDAFAAAGFNFIDTADVYSVWVPGHQGGESEAVIGKWMTQGNRRQDMIIATKVGMEMSPDKKGLSRAQILRSVEGSLKRLQTDYIDLYQSHTDDAETPVDEPLETYARLIEQGKVRAIGASNYTAERLSQALQSSEQGGYPSYQTLQPLYNLYDRADYEANLEPLCLERGLGVITYFSLASGFLTGKYRTEDDLSKSPRGRRVKQYLNDRGSRILQALDEVASCLNSTPARVSLAWLIARPSIAAPIASATSLDQLNDLIEATRLELDASSMALLNNASALEAQASLPA
jgi:aryl-alcohol dehydrogenase-like predicted oxidoreductase